jgi:hypothetical protein
MLSPRQREHFAERGFVRLPGVFSRDAAAAMEQRVWEWLERHHGVRRDDPASWTLAQPTGLQPLKHQAVFDPNGGALLLEALDELLGAGCWKRPREWGGFLVSFPSAGETRARAPWHTDFDYRGPSDRVFGALVFSYLCDVPAGAGGTLVVAGSQRVIRRFVEGRSRASLAPMKTVRLALMHSDPWLAALAAEENAAGLDLAPLRGERSVAGVPVEIVELSGEAGDVVIGHPWLLHRGAPNRGERPRFMRVQRVLAGL